MVRIDTACFLLALVTRGITFERIGWRALAKLSTGSDPQPAIYPVFSKSFSGNLPFQAQSSSCQPLSKTSEGNFSVFEAKRTHGH